MNTGAGYRADPDAFDLWCWEDVGAPELHPSTAPAAVARDQRAAVRAAVRDLGPGWTAEAVSAAAVLPVSVVRRRLRELGLGEGGAC